MTGGTAPGSLARVLLVVALVAAGLPPLGLDPTLEAEASHAVEEMTTLFPSPRSHMAVAAVGDTAFFFGGYDERGMSNQIYRYKATTNSLTVAPGQLPQARVDASAAGDARGVYVFGGYSGRMLDQILRFDLANATALPVAAKLPTPRFASGAVWDGTYAYVFGGYDGAHLDEVVRFDPGADRAEVLPVRLPAPMSYMGVAWDGSSAYLLGGVNNAGIFDWVLRFDPVALNFTQLAARLPRPTYSLAATWGEGFLYAFGGAAVHPDGATRNHDQVARVDPATNQSVVFASLPSVSGGSVREGLSAAWLNSRAYVTGGGLREVLELEPRTGQMSVTNPLLPFPAEGPAGAFAAGRAYAFGGGGSDQVAAYDPLRNTVTYAARLPSGRSWASAASDGTTIYVFGGEANTQLDEIVRYHAPTATVSVMKARLPTPLGETSAVWAGDRAYVFGGYTGSPGPAYEVDRIVRYVPGTDSVATMPTKLPEARRLTAAVWDERDRPADGCAGGCAYVFGGYSCTPSRCGYFDDILRYNPESGALTRMGAPLPSPRAYLSAAWDGRFAYLFGGHDPASPQRDILRYDPVNDTLAFLGAKLPSPRYGGAASFDGARMYYLGGAYSRDVLVYDLRVEGQFPPVPLMRPVPQMECVNGRATAALDGSDSYDPNGDPFNLTWSADNTTFANASAARTTASFRLPGATLRLTARDDFAGSDNFQPITVKDSFPPVTSARPSGTSGTNGWWRSAVRVDLAGSDACGVAAIHYNIDGPSWVRGTTANVTGDAYHYLYFQATDLGGNLEWVRDDAGNIVSYRWIPVPIDTRAPTVNLTDPLGGVAYMDDRPLLADLSVPLETPEQICVPYIRCRTLPPVRLPTLPNVGLAFELLLGKLGNSSLVVGNKTLQAEADDTLSGVAYVEFGADNHSIANDTEPPFTALWEAGRETAGNHTLWARAVDAAGNEARSTRNVYTLPTTRAGLVATAQCRVLLRSSHCATLEQAEAADPRTFFDAIDRLHVPVSCETVLSKSNCDLLTGGG